jgi:hypothetical protein
MRSIARGIVAVLLLLGSFAALPAVSRATDPVEKSTGTGFEGRVVHEGEVVAGAHVYAYKTFADVIARKPFAVSAPTADDGSWKLDLPKGKYYLVAKKRKTGDGDGSLGAGDDYSYHGSNPVTVVPGKYTHVGFSVVRIEGEPVYEAIADKGSGAISGVVTLNGKPAEGVNVLLYVDDQHDFRGMAFSSSPPTRADGMFRFDFLPEADYYVLARKRATGKGAGPLTDGDIFGFYVANPLPVKAGKVARIRLGVISKAGEIGKEDSLFRDTGTYIAGKILDRAGKPVKGAYAFVYSDKVMAHRRPDHISRPADAAGRYVINLPQGGRYYVGARSDYGDTPGYGEWYGRYEGTPDHSLRIETGKVLDNVDLSVEQILR